MLWKLYNCISVFLNFLILYTDGSGINGKAGALVVVGGNNIIKQAYMGEENHLCYLYS